jgi:TatD DNase family protein
MLIDTHAHLNFDAYKDDADEVIRRSLDDEVWMINVGSHYEASKRAVEIAEKYKEGVYAAVGLHPINLDTGLLRIKIDNEEGSHFEKEFDYEKYKELVKSKKVVAIGEIGLDYYWRPKTTAKKEIFKQKQKDLLLKELGLSQELDLPIIFHCRMAHDDLIKIIGEQLTNNNKQIRGVVHCFTGSWEQVIKKTPLERILVETDCPYLSPPEFKKERNEPIAVKYIAREIAKIKNMDYKEINAITSHNAREFFKINIYGKNTINKIKSQRNP